MERKTSNVENVRGTGAAGKCEGRVKNRFWPCTSRQRGPGVWRRTSVRRQRAAHRMACTSTLVAAPSRCNRPSAMRRPQTSVRRATLSPEMPRPRASLNPAAARSKDLACKPIRVAARRPASAMVGSQGQLLIQRGKKSSPHRRGRHSRPVPDAVRAPDQVIPCGQRTSRVGKCSL